MIAGPFRIGLDQQFIQPFMHAGQGVFQPQFFGFGILSDSATDRNGGSMQNRMAHGKATIQLDPVQPQGGNSNTVSGALF